MKNPMVLRTRLSKGQGEGKVDETLFKQRDGSLMYLTITRLDMINTMSLISIFMTNPTMAHQLATKRILWYVKGTTNLGLQYKKRASSLTLLVFIDSDYVDDWTIRKAHLNMFL